MDSRSAAEGGAARAADLNIDSLYLNSAPPLIAGQISRAPELDAITEKRNGGDRTGEQAVDCDRNGSNACREMSRSSGKRGVGGNHPNSARREMQPNGIYKTIFLHSLSGDRRFKHSLFDRDHPRESRHHPPMGARRREKASIDFEILHTPLSPPWTTTRFGWFPSRSRSSLHPLLKGVSKV